MTPSKTLGHLISSAIGILIITFRDSFDVGGYLGRIEAIPQ